MLNEFQDIANAIEAAGVKLVSLDKRITGAAKGEKLCFEIGRENVESTRLLPAEVVKRSWTIANGNKNSFPFVRLQSSLLDHGLSKSQVAALKKDLFKCGAKLTETICRIQQAIEQHKIQVVKINGWESYRCKIEQRLERLQKIDSNYIIVPKTHERFLKITHDFPSLTRELVAVLGESLRNPTEDLVKLVFSMLFEGGVQICFEAQEDEFEFAITDPELKIPVSECLADAHQNSEKQREHTCILSGKPDSKNTSAFPQPNLPLLGRTPLFARKQDVECRHRYHKKGVETIGVGQDTISRMQAGLDAICSEGREGKTWAKIPSETPSSRDLLVAYVESNLDIPIASALNEDAVVSEAKFDEKSRRVIEAARAHQLNHKAEPRLRLMVIRKVDTANRKIVYSGSEPVANFLTCCDRWVESFQQVPPVRLSVPVGKGNPALRTGPSIIAPANFIVLSKERFKDDGKRKDEVPGGRFFDVLQLFLGSTRRREVAARRWLEILYPRRRQLVIGIAEANRRSFDDYKQYDAWGALSTVSAFHILLLNLGRKGDIYMNDAAFKLGQLLAAADELHCGYCHDVRNGSLPSQLMGNALVPMAEQNPVKALSVLCRRWPVYDRWAKTRNFPVDEKFAISGEKLSARQKAEKKRQWSIANGISAVMKARPLAAELKNKLSTKTNQEFRAELILGYITGIRNETHNSKGAKDGV
ncbi:MAG: hypothetical protein WBD31_04125 [Rubripirellula sp.]